MVLRYRHMIEQMGLVIRNADNTLRSGTKMKSEQDVMDFIDRLCAKDHQRLLAAAAITMKKASKRSLKRAVGS